MEYPPGEFCDLWIMVNFINYTAYIATLNIQYEDSYGKEFQLSVPIMVTLESSSSSGGGGGGGGGGCGVFGAVSINDLIGYHLDAIRKDGTRIYMPVTEGYKALKGAQTHIEGLLPALANIIRGGFESLERKAEVNKDGVLYWIGTHLYPILGR